MRGRVLVLAFAFFFIVSGQAAFAQFGLFSGNNAYSQDIWNMVSFLIPGMRPEWMSIPNFFYYVVFPFIAAWAVIYGIMEEIQIFRRAKTSHKVVSLVMAAMLLPSGWLLIIVNYFYMIDAWVALMAFGVVFLLGTIFWGYGRSAYMWSEGREAGLKHGWIRDLQGQERDLKRQIDDITRRMATDKKADLDKLTTQREELYLKVGELRKKRAAVYGGGWG